jgi:hypothetical protein
VSFDVLPKNMANALPKLRVFEYIALLDAFDVTEQY